jgi:hypothetical protein
MNDNTNIFGCYISITSGNFDDDQKIKNLLTEQGRLFRTYIWGEKGICDVLKKLKNEDYGTDLILALFQFYVNPLLIEQQYLKEIENYRKREKSIGIPIIVNNENFFNRSEEERYNFLKQSIFQKLHVLTEVVKKKKLDTNMEMLKSDLKKIF